MGQISGTPKEKIVKITISSKLEEELLRNYNNITNFFDTVQETKLYLNSLAQDFEPDPDFDNKLNSFIQNLNEYIPNFENNPDGTNEYLDELKNILIETYDGLPEGLDILESLNIKSFDDISNLTELPPNFVDVITNNVISGSITNVLTDFPLKEFSMGSVLSVAEHNLGIQDIQGSINNIVTISDTLINKFPDVANMEAIQGMLNTLPDKLSNMAIDTLGNLDVNKLIEDIGNLPSFEDISNLINVKDVMNNMIGNITGQIAGIVDGIAGCGCSLSLGGISGIVDSIDGIKDLGQKTIGKLNSTMESIIEDIPISNFPNVDQLKDAVNNQLNEYKTIAEDTTKDWADITKT